MNETFFVFSFMVVSSEIYIFHIIYKDYYNICIFVIAQCIAIITKYTMYLPEKFQ